MKVSAEYEDDVVLEEESCPRIWRKRQCSSQVNDTTGRDIYQRVLDKSPKRNVKAKDPSMSICQVVTAVIVMRGWLRNLTNHRHDDE